MPHDVAPQKQKTLKLLHLLKNISVDWSRVDVLYTVNSLPWRTFSQDTENKREGARRPQSRGKNSVLSHRLLANRRGNSG